MLVLMCGLPSSGKSTAANIVSSSLAAMTFRPEDWLPDDFDMLDKNTQRQYRFACWGTAIDSAREATADFDNSKVIILDCGNSKYHTVQDLLKKAKRRKHKTMLLFVHCPTNLCKDRAGNAWIGQEKCDEYIKCFKESLPKYKANCDVFTKVLNDSSKEDLEQKLQPVLELICRNI